MLRLDLPKKILLFMGIAGLIALAAYLGLGRKTKDRYDDPSLIKSLRKDADERATADTDSLNVVMVTILNRHSSRHFTKKPVSSIHLSLLARAGMAAPTACNKQPWAIMAIDDSETLNKLYDSMQYRDSMAFAPAAMVICGDTTKMLPEVAHEFWVQDCSAMTENILIAAESLELGTVWTGVYPIPERVSAVTSALSLPSNIIPLCVILVGHASCTDKPKDKWNPNNYHYNRW